MSNGVIVFREEHVTLFRMPSVVVSKGHYLDSWKDKIWRGNLFLKTNPDLLTVELKNYDGTLYAKSYVKENVSNFIEKCLDSSRGYAIKLTNDNDERFAWVGMVFHDRTSAFQFFVTFQDHLQRKKQKITPIKVDPNLNFKLKKGNKIKINVGGVNKDEKNELYFGKNNNSKNNVNIVKNQKIQNNDLSGFKLNIGKSKKNKNYQEKTDFLDFGNNDNFGNNNNNFGNNSNNYGNNNNNNFGNNNNVNNNQQNNNYQQNNLVNNNLQKNTQNNNMNNNNKIDADFLNF